MIPHKNTTSSASKTTQGIFAREMAFSPQNRSESQNSNQSASSPSKSKPRIKVGPSTPSKSPSVRPRETSDIHVVALIDRSPSMIKADLQSPLVKSQTYKASGPIFAGSSPSPTRSKSPVDRKTQEAGTQNIGLATSIPASFQATMTSVHSAVSALKSTLPPVNSSTRNTPSKQPPSSTRGELFHRQMSPLRSVLDAINREIKHKREPSIGSAFKKSQELNCKNDEETTRGEDGVKMDCSRRLSTSTSSFTKVIAADSPQVFTPNPSTMSYPGATDALTAIKCNLNVQKVLKLVENEADAATFDSLTDYGNPMPLSVKLEKQRLIIKFLTQKLRRESAIRFKNEREFEVKLLSDAVTLDTLVILNLKQERQLNLDSKPFASARKSTIVLSKDQDSLI